MQLTDLGQLLNAWLMLTTGQEVSRPIPLNDS